MHGPLRQPTPDAEGFAIRQCVAAAVGAHGALAQMALLFFAGAQCSGVSALTVGMEERVDIFVAALRGLLPHRCRGGRSCPGERVGRCAERFAGGGVCARIPVHNLSRRMGWGSADYSVVGATDRCVAVGMRPPQPDSQTDCSEGDNGQDDGEEFDRS